MPQSSLTPQSYSATRQTQDRLKTILGAAALLFACLVLFSFMRSNIRFMDEMDNFSIGLQMTKGGTLYTTLFSQHMPLPYYICALFARLGAHTVLEFRLYWYVFLSLCYVAVYLRYYKWYGRAALALWPVFYLWTIPSTPLCTSILAEQLQAIGMVVLLLEFLHFVKTRAVSVASAVSLAVGINIAFLSAVVAAFACAGIVLAYVAYEIADCAKQRRSFPASVRYLWGKYWRTIGFTLAPMVLFALWFVVNGQWADFWYKAITFNTQVYSEYQGGFGASPLGAVIGCFTQYIAWGKTLVQTLFQGAASVPPVVTVLFCAQYAFLAVLAWRRRWGAAVAVQIFFILCGSRGFYNYHALQCFALNSVMLALLCGMLWRMVFARGQVRAAVQGRANCAAAVSHNSVNTAALRAEAKLSSTPVRAAALLACVACCATLITAGGSFFYERRNMPLLPTQLERNPEYEAHSNEALLMALTDNGEYILQNINNEDLFLETHVRAPSYNTAPSPWWWIATRESSMQSIRENPPRVAVYDPQYTAFGEYVVKDFAPEMDAFVRENYTLLYEDAPFFYVHKDYLATAHAKLPPPESDSDMVGTTRPNVTCGDALENASVQQHFTAARGEMKTLAVQLGTHSRPYTGSVEAALTRDATGETVASWRVEGKQIIDNAFTFFHRAQDAPIPLVQGEDYTLTLTAQHKSDEQGDKNITVWAAENEATQTSYAQTAQGKQSYSLRVKIR